MVSGTDFNMGYNGSYMIMPLPKTKAENGAEFSVKVANKDFNDDIDVPDNTKRQNMESLMGTLDDIKRADSNNDGIISLNELKKCDDKSEFMEHLIFELEKFEKAWKASNNNWG